MKKIITCAALTIFLAPSFVFADGGVVRFDPYSDRWDFSDETNQQAFINYENGTEKMILSVGVGNAKEGKTMWIFPVPADPQKVAVDVLKKIPNLQGEEISKKAQSNLNDAVALSVMSQIYTILPYAMFGNRLLSAPSGSGDGSFSSPMGTSLGAGSQDLLRPDVIVYEHLDKEGITSEIVTARTAQGFNEYFSKKGLKIDNGSMPVLNNYIGKNFSFVVSWIEAGNMMPPNPPSNGPVQVPYNGAANTPNVNQKGVFVSFPTDKIFFPLMPTSVYGSKIVPADIRIIGHVSPIIFNDIKSFTKTEYYNAEYAQFDNTLKAFYNGTSQKLKYTKIEINAPSKFFTDDLKADSAAPIGVYYKNAFAAHPVLAAILILVVSSFLAGALIGWLIFKEWRDKEGFKKFGLVGLANCVTILGLIAAILPARTIKDPEDASREVDEIKTRGYFWKRRISLGLIIADFPFLLISIFAIPAFFSEWVNVYTESQISSDYYGGGEVWLYFLYFAISMVPVAVLAVAWYLSRIKKEDRELFGDLKKKKYSAWTFQPKDARKMAFIIIFSLLFLFISWLITRLLIFSVGG